MDKKVSEMSTGGAAIGVIVVIVVSLFAYTALQKAFTPKPVTT